MRRRPWPWRRPGASRPRPAGLRPLPSSVRPMSCSPRPWPCRRPAAPCPPRCWPCRPRPRVPRPGRRSHSAACARRRTRPRPPPARRRGRAPRRPPRSALASVHPACSSAAEPRSASRSWSLMTPAFSCAWTSAFASSAFERSFRPQIPRAIATTATPTVAHSHGCATRTCGPVRRRAWRAPAGAADRCPTWPSTLSLGSEASIVRAGVSGGVHAALRVHRRQPLSLTGVARSDDASR